MGMQKFFGILYFLWLYHQKEHHHNLQSKFRFACSSNIEEKTHSPPKFWNAIRTPQCQQTSL